MTWFATRLETGGHRPDNLRRFAADETGAVTVDFVVLSAAVVGLAIGATTAIRNGSVGVSDTIESSLISANIGTISFTGN